MRFLFFANITWEKILLLILIMVFTLNSLFVPYYFSLENILALSQSYIELGVLGFAVILLLISGNIDISIAGIVAFSATIFAICFSFGIPIPFCIIITLITGTLCGILNALLIVGFSIPSIIVTLATMSVFRGLSYVLLKDDAIYGFPKSFTYFGTGYIPNTYVPLELIVFPFLILITWFILHQSTFGKKIYSVGLNPEASFRSGINVKQVNIIVFAWAGFLYSLAAILLVSRIGSVRPNIATGYELEIIATVVFGGTAIFGGYGNVWGYVLAFLTLVSMRSGLALLNVPGQYMAIIFGLVLIFSILANNFINQINERKILEKRSKDG